jgi:DNA-binding transcriptional MerR regulator
MDKSPDAFRTISEVAESLDLPQHVLRFWESRFPQIKPLKRGGGRRYYRPDDVELLRAIKHLLYDEGYTIKGVQRLFKEQGARALALKPVPVEETGSIQAPEPQFADLATSDPDEDFESQRQEEPTLSAAEIDALRAALADLAECERILTQARTR